MFHMCSAACIYSFSFVCGLTPLLIHMLAGNLLKAALAFATLMFILSFMVAFWDCATKRGETVHCIQSLTFDCDVRLNIWFLWGCLMQYFHLLYADDEARVCAGGKELVNAALNVSFQASVEGQVAANRKSLMMSIMILDFA